MNQNSENEILPHGFLLCVLVARKNIRLAIWKFKKILHKTDYHV
jgi:hypothetical protein